MRVFQFILYSLCFTIVTACDTAPVITENRVFDFTTNGFLDDHHYQVTASSRPDDGVRGLVAQRENALTRARNELQVKTVQSLVSYRFSNYLKEHAYYSEASCPDADEVKRQIQNKVLPYINYGKLVDEYYEKDNSARVVYRIEMNNLRQSLDSISVVLKKSDSPKEN